MGLLDRVNSRLAPAGRHQRGLLSWDEYQEFFAFGGAGSPFIQTTMGSLDREKVAASAIAAYKSSGPVFALVLARMQVFSQVRFQWTRFSGSVPGDLFGTPELSVLETPWPGGTTPDLLARMELHNSLAGNAYVRRTKPGQLNVLRPDLVTIILGSQEDPGDPALAADTEVAGYFYTPAGGRPRLFLPDEVAHFAPIPDPWFHFLGQSWITPVVRELQADQASVEHKWRFFENNATVNLAVKFDANVGIEAVRAFKELMEEEHRGLANAFRTLYMGGGADATLVGSTLKDMDYAVVQGRAESRLAAAAGVPPSWVGFSEGLEGSALNAGNFDSARRRFADGTMVHLWGNAAASLQAILTPPDSRASLWYDARVPFMREDAGDIAKIQGQQATTIGTLVKDGFTPDSAVKAVLNDDMSLLKHTGLVSVQLLPPGELIDRGPGQPPTPPEATPPPAASANGTGRIPAPAAGGNSGAAARRAIAGYPAAPGPRSGMISLDLPPSTIQPVPGGVSDHHVTIVYLGPDVDDDAFAQACDRAAQAASQAGGPISGTVGGLVVFPPSGDGTMPVFAHAVLPGASGLRSGLEDLSASEHATWVPHVTLAYAGPGDVLPPAPPLTPVTITHLSVHRGDDVTRFPLGTPAAAPAPRDQVIATA
jgi:2'-5' RNA ligase